MYKWPIITISAKNCYNNQLTLHVSSLIDNRIWQWKNSDDWSANLNTYQFRWWQHSTYNIFSSHDLQLIYWVIVDVVFLFFLQFFFVLYNHFTIQQLITQLFSSNNIIKKKEWTSWLFKYYFVWQLHIFAYIYHLYCWIFLQKHYSTSETKKKKKKPLFFWWDKDWKKKREETEKWRRKKDQVWHYSKIFLFSFWSNFLIKTQQKRLWEYQRSTELYCPGHPLLLLLIFFFFCI